MAQPGTYLVLNFVAFPPASCSPFPAPLLQTALPPALVACTDLMAQRGTFLVPTLITYHQLLEGGAAAGMAPELVAKVGSLVEQVGLEPGEGSRARFCSSRPKRPQCAAGELARRQGGWWQAGCQHAGRHMRCAAAPGRRPALPRARRRACVPPDAMLHL